MCRLDSASSGRGPEADSCEVFRAFEFFNGGGFVGHLTDHELLEEEFVP